MFKVQRIPVPGGDEMKGQRGNDLVLEPGEIAIGRELKAIRMVQGIARELRQVPGY